MTITPEKDIDILLGDKPFPLPLTHLTLETEIVGETAEESELPIVHLAGPSVLRLYNHEQLVASTPYYDLDPEGRFIRLSETRTTIHQPGA